MRTRPWTMLLMMLAGWINSYQQDVIEYLREENKILKEKLGKKRIVLNDNQRMRLARLGKKLGRKVLSDACCTFSPDTILMWHRKLVAKKYDGSDNRKGGRRRITQEVVDLIIMLARKIRPGAPGGSKELSSTWALRSAIQPSITFLKDMAMIPVRIEAAKRNGLNF